MTETSVFAFLRVGHALGDFVFQSATLVQRKRQPGTRLLGLFQHAFILLACEAIGARPLTCFRVDQVGHLAALGFLANHWETPLAPWPTDPWLAIESGTLAFIARARLVVSAWIFAARAGAFVVAMILESCQISAAPNPTGSSSPPLG